MIKKSKYLNETQKYEAWKKEFREEMQKVLTEIFSKRFPACFISVYKVDKWNVEFNISSLPIYLGELERNSSLSNILTVYPIFGENGRRTCILKAKTLDEFDAKLGYLKIII